MADTMKFGPEWLRALSDGNSVTSPPPSPAPSLGTKYKLAEHRYGREEMLALFVPNSKIPEEVKETPSICVEKAQHPLAFMQPCEEEQRLMSQSVNSSVVLRMMGQGRGGPMSRGGRGGPADRGRGLGRGRGRGEGYYQRGPFDDEGFGRGRPRSEAWDDRDKRFDRGFPSKPGFDEGPVSPRRELSRSMSTDNWRDAKKEEEDDGDWRRAGPKDRWGSRSSWRDQPRPYDSDFHGRFNDYSRDPRDRRPAPFDQDRSFRSRSRSTGSWDDDPETLPEWSTTDVEDMGNVGTFDSSGAFMSLKDFGEEDELEGGLTDPQEKSAKEQNRPGEKGETKENGTAGQEVDKRQSQKAAGSPGSAARPTKDNTKTAPPVKGKLSSGKENTPDRGAADADKPAAIKSSVKGEGGNTTGRGDSFVNSAHSVATVEGQRADPGAQISMETKTASSLVSSAATTTSVTVNAQPRGEGVPSVRPGAPPPAQNGATGGATVTAANIDSHNSARATHSGTDSRAGSQQAGQGKTRPDEEADFDHLEKAAESLVATMDDEDVRVENVAKVEQGALSMDHEDAKKWFYRDPQGDLQGPFSAAEMSEWFSAGYFTMNLLVKRGCDDTFQPLGELIKAWGRVPFLPGPALPPLKSTPQASAVVNPIPAAGNTPSTTAAGVGTPEQLKVLQHQVLMQQQLIQQQALLRQLQLQQILQSIQQQPAFAKLSLQEQQHLALQLLIKQQTGMFQQQQQQQLQAAAGGADAQQVASRQTPPSGGGSPQPQPEQPQPMKLSPRSCTAQEEVAPPSGGLINHPGFHRSLSQPGHNTAPDFHRSMSTPSGEQASLWGAAPGMPAPASDGGSSWSQSGGSVWDIETPKPAEDVQRAELERIQREQEEREREERRKEEERRQLEEEERRRREHQEMQRQQEIERQKERERQREMERQNEIKKQELERQEMERQQMEQLRREQEIEERRRREEDERRQRQEEEDRERRRVEELQRLEEERKRRGAEDQMEKKRQEEIRRRQEKEEIRRQQQQQQEALRRMQQEQMAKMQLPATAQWASGPVTSSPSALSLAQIQQLEAETERKEQIERQRKLEAQRQQLAAIQQQQQQQQQQNARWSNAPSGAPSLLDIQQEQARQQHDEIHRQQQQQPQVKPSLPLSSAAVWGNNAAPSSHWATEGAWGNNPQNSTSLGFWDDAVNVSNKKTSVNNNAHFPSLTPSVQPNAANMGANRGRTTKAKKEEESVQRLFNAMKPTDEFTQWCENALRGMQTSVDIPTFIAFLLEVDSAYEVHDYVRSYLGEGREAEEFARVFLEKRRKHRNHMTQQRQDDFVWNTMQSADSQSQGQVVGEDEFKSVKSKKRNTKKKMQKLDSSILGFTVHAAPDRIVGEIETGDKV